MAERAALHHSETRGKQMQTSCRRLDRGRKAGGAGQGPARGTKHREPPQPCGLRAPGQSPSGAPGLERARPPRGGRQRKGGSRGGWRDEGEVEERRSRRACWLTPLRAAERPRRRIIDSFMATCGVFPCFSR